MANGILAYEGDIPDYIRKAAQGVLDKKAASDARKVSVMADEGGMRPSVTKAASNALKEYAKGSLKYEGGMRESVRKAAEKALQGGVAETAPATKAASKVGPVAGLLSAYEGGQMLNDAFNPMSRAKELDQLQSWVWNQKNPEAAAKAKSGMEGIADRAVEAAKAGVQAGSDQYKKNAAEGAYPLFKAASPQVAAQAESKRQVVEAGAKEQLRTGQLSRPKAAEAVVQADLQRKGVKASPKEVENLVKQESASMKNMDDDQLSKYLSYALIAGGLIASALDDSGSAGQAFAGGFNAQLDRNQQMAMFKEKKKAEAEAAQAAQQQWQAEYDLKKLDSESKAEKRTADTKIGEVKTTALLDKWEKEAANADAKLAAYRDRTVATAKGGQSSGSGKGVYLTPKENRSIIDSYANAKNINLDTAVVESMLPELANLQKLHPEAPTEKHIQYLLKRYTNEGSTDPWGPGDYDASYKLGE